VLSLAFGIGANTVIFGLANAVLLRPLPVANPDDVVALYTSDHSGPRYSTSSYPDYLDFRDKTDVFSGLAASGFEALSFAQEGQTARVWAEVVTGNYFPFLGIPVARGRGLVPEDDAPSAAPVAVLSHGTWSRRLGGDESILGRTLTLNGRPVTVAGVAAPSFTGLTRGIGVDLWLPLAVHMKLVGREDRLDNRGSRRLQILGRLRPGVTAEAAQARLDVLARQLREAYPQQWTDVREEGRRITVVPERLARVSPRIRGPVIGFFGLLMLVVGLVLLIACANVANLLLARMAARRREIAIRLSLGALRGRIVRQFVTETALATLLGGALGVLIAVWCADGLTAWRLPLPLPVELEVAVDWRVLLFALALSLATGIALGLAPALPASRQDVVPALKDEALVHADGGRRSRLRDFFLVSQVALCLVLLVGAGLLLRGLRNAGAIDPGFDPDNVLVLSVDLGLAEFPETRAAAWQQDLRARLGSIPGVESVGLSAGLPMSLSWARRGTTVEGYTRRPGEDMEFHFNVVGPGFLEALRIPLVRGRRFTEKDRAGAAGVVIVNQTFARRFWPGQDPLGRRLSVSGEEGPYLEVVGVTRDGKYNTLGEEPLPFFYLPLLQHHDSVRRAVEPASLVVRTTGDPRSAAPAVRQAVQALDPRVPVQGARLLVEHLGVSLLPSRVAGWMLGLFGLLGLALASLGLYGVVSQAVSRRHREIGVRIALGADRREVMRLIVGEGMTLVGIGLGVGLVLSLAATRLLTSLLYGLSPTDPLTFLGVCLLLAAVAFLASYVPARRATRIDPIAALRYE
jgi:predicted permease